MAAAANRLAALRAGRVGEVRVGRAIRFAATGMRVEDVACERAMPSRRRVEGARAALVALGLHPAPHGPQPLIERLAGSRHALQHLVCVAHELELGLPDAAGFRFAVSGELNTVDYLARGHEAFGAAFDVKEAVGAAQLVPTGALHAVLVKVIRFPLDSLEARLLDAVDEAECLVVLDLPLHDLLYRLGRLKGTLLLAACRCNGLGRQRARKGDEEQRDRHARHHPKRERTLVCPLRDKSHIIHDLSLHSACLSRFAPQPRDELQDRPATHS